MNELFGKRFKQLRKAKKMNQQEIANIFNISQRTISGWEIGRVEPSIKKLFEIAKYFDVSLDYLYGKVDYKNDSEAFKYYGLKTPEEMIEELENNNKKLKNIKYFCNKCNKWHFDLSECKYYVNVLLEGISKAGIEFKIISNYGDIDNVAEYTRNIAKTTDEEVNFINKEIYNIIEAKKDKEYIKIIDNMIIFKFNPNLL